MAKITIDTDELVTVRNAMRSMPTLVNALNDGLVEKLVLMRRGKVVAVLLDVNDYMEMVEKSKGDPSNADGIQHQ